MRFVITTLLLCALWGAFLPAAQAQQNADTTRASADTLKLPRYDVHLGLGLANGVRGGFRCLFTHHWSAEAGVGLNTPTLLRSAIGWDTDSPPPKTVYSFGWNWHKNAQESSLIVSALIAHSRLTWLSTTIGLFSMAAPGTHLWGRIGGAIVLSPNSAVPIFPDIDVGISLSW